MYQVAIYDEQGAIESATPAETFDDAVCDLFRTLGVKPAYKVRATKNGKLFGLEVHFNDNLIADIQDVAPAEPHADGLVFARIVSACNALDAGDARPIERLFSCVEDEMLPHVDMIEVPGTSLATI